MDRKTAILAGEAATAVIVGASLSKPSIASPFPPAARYRHWLVPTPDAQARECRVGVLGDRTMSPVLRDRWDALSRASFAKANSSSTVSEPKTIALPRGLACF